MTHTTRLSIGLGLLMSVATLTCSAAPDADAAVRLVGQYRAVWTARPGRTPANHSVDGPLMGNGDMKVAIGGPAEEQQLFLAKNDMWRLKSQYGQSCPVGFGRLAIRIPELAGASYKLEQRWDVPETVGTFTRDGLTVRMKSMVAATENLLLLELAAEGRAVDAEAVLRVATGRGSMSKAERRGDVIFGQRAFTEDVDIPSGAAVAWKVLGAETSSAKGGATSVSAKMQSHRVNIGREQIQGGRWGFQGSVDDLRVYGRAFTQKEMSDLVAGKAPDGAAHVWSMDEAPANKAPMRVVPGKVGKAWQFTGDKACFLDCGNLPLPVEPVTMACWVRIDDAHEQANYILSCGEWNKGVSIGLSAGKLRFTAAGGKYVESAVLPKDKWVHVAGTWDGAQLTAYVDGEIANAAGSTGVQPVGARFTLKPGKPVTLVLAMDSVFKSKTYAEDVVAALAHMSHESHTSHVAGLRKAHAAWWTDFWAKSFVEIGDPELEKAYYRSLYHMGACSRDLRFPPGIFGWVTTDNPAWAGDYHLNYNHMAPFYALYSANRVEQGDPQDTPILDFRERGRWYAKAVFGEKMRGVHYPVGIGPLGIETTRKSKYGGGRHSEGEGLFFGQRTNPSYCLVNIAQRWRTTRDAAYGKKVYPFVLEVVSFWEDYLKWEPRSSDLRSETRPSRLQAGGAAPQSGAQQVSLPEQGATGDGRYVDYNDSIHEGSGKNMNPILALGLIRNAFDLALDMSGELNVDAGRQKKWRHILDHLSLWTTQEMKGKTVFRYSEDGTHWWRNNTLGIQHIYPGNALGLDSDPKWLEVAHNTIAVMQRWIDGNGSNSFFPAAVRVGYDPKVILEQLQRYVRNTYPNGFQLRNPHGIENQSTVPNTINEMLCMSHVPGGANPGGHLLRVFPVWPRNRDAKFVNIRAWGAFLVSSELNDGQVQHVKITSERGKDCTMVNPWPGRTVTLTRANGTETLDGDRFTFETGVGEQLELAMSDKAAVVDRSAWFAGKWGVFFHYLANPAGRANEGKSAEEWSRQVDAFDVKGLAKQLQEVGADYFFITIGQGSGHYCARNPVYDKLTGISPSKCARRDLVSDLADTLNPLGIKVLVYTAAEIGWGDVEARKALGMTSHHNDHLVGLRKRGQPNDWQANRKGQIEFLWNWVKIHEQWSKQWGTKIAGWWVDGCYHADVRFPENEPPNLKTLKAALRTGNPNAIVTFNTRGVKVPIPVSSPHEDYAAGEVSRQLPSSCPGAWLEGEGIRSRYHSLSYLGRTWGQGDKPRFSDEVVIKYTRDVTSKGGFVSWDVPHTEKGLIPEAFMKQLRKVAPTFSR